MRRATRAWRGGAKQAATGAIFFLGPAVAIVVGFNVPEDHEVAGLVLVLGGAAFMLGGVRDVGGAGARRLSVGGGPRSCARRVCACSC